MTQQPLFGPPETPAQTVRASAEPAPLWLQRFSLIVLVLFCIMLGILVTILPWSPQFWTHNTWMILHPSAAHVLQQGWVRGLVSGLGLLDIWVGISEAMHYRDEGKATV